MEGVGYAAAERGDLSAMALQPGTLERLDGQLEQLERGIEDLRARLGGVLKADLPSQVASLKTEPISGLAGKVDRLAEVNGWLRDVIERIDL